VSQRDVISQCRIVVAELRGTNSDLKIGGGLRRNRGGVQRGGVRPPVSSTPRAPRRVSTDGNGVSLLRRSNNSSSADGMMIRRRMITKEEWNGAPHAHQKTTDDPNNLGRYKIAARRRRKINGLKRVA